MNNNERTQEIMVKYKIDDNEITLTPKIVQDYLVGKDTKITLPEFKLFTELCKVRKLNPFLKEAYLIKYSDKQPASIVVGKDAIVKRAVLNTNFNGMESGVIVLNENNEMIERKGTFKLPNEKLVGAWAKVFRKDWEYPIYQSVSLSEVDKASPNWKSMPAVMCEKVAKVRALREAFVEDLGGMYEEDEIKTDVPKTKEEVIVQDDVIEAEVVEKVNLNEL